MSKNNLDISNLDTNDLREMARLYRELAGQLDQLADDADSGAGRSGSLGAAMERTFRSIAGLLFHSFPSIASVRVDLPASASSGTDGITVFPTTSAPKN